MIKYYETNIPKILKENNILEFIGRLTDKRLFFSFHFHDFEVFHEIDKIMKRNYVCHFTGTDNYVMLQIPFSEQEIKDYEDALCFP